MQRYVFSRKCGRNDIGVCFGGGHLSMPLISILMTMIIFLHRNYFFHSCPLSSFTNATNNKSDKKLNVHNFFPKKNNSNTLMAIHKPPHTRRKNHNKQT
mmetsp:Transcript_8349/g.11239  ORF Transcript_8349/g.11239 Transcript_8349/m.11239 type:complete len:99 (-) Transcript_8349:565-861(-)